MRQTQGLADWLNSKFRLAKSEILALRQAFLLNLHARSATWSVLEKLVRYLSVGLQERIDPTLDLVSVAPIMVEANESRAGRLSDVFLPLLAYILGFERAPTGSADDLAATLNQLIGDAQTRALSEGYDADLFTEGLFPVVAWVDERVSLLHNWENSHAWQAHLLQQRYFRTTHAGLRFFETLEDTDVLAIDVLELYFLCMCMGFKGKYNHRPNDPELAEIRQQLFTALESAGWAVPLQSDELLFPAAYQPLEEEQPVHEAWWKKWTTPKWLSIIVAPPLAFLLILIICSVRLSSSIDAFWKPLSL